MKIISQNSAVPVSGSLRTVSHSRMSGRSAIEAAVMKESRGQRETRGNDDIEGELIRLFRQLGAVHDGMGKLFYKLGLFSKRQGQLAAILASQPQPGPTAEEDCSKKPIVFVVRVTKGFDGRIWVQIGDRDPLPMPKGLADLLVLLATDSDVRVKADDPFVGWKSRESIAAAL